VANRQRVIRLAAAEDQREDQGRGHGERDGTRHDRGARPGSMRAAGFAG
jgi:hypothetical protein